MDKNFAGQNLNGRSFRGADFSGCQLKSCDFTDADLTGANFFRVTLGVDGRHKLANWFATVALCIISGFLTWFLNIIFAFAVNEIYKYFTGINVPMEENVTLPLIGSLYAVSICLSVHAALKYRNWWIVTGNYLVILIAAAVMIVIYLLLGWYLNRRCLQFEEPMLALLRRYALVWRCWGGTQFSDATLAHTDFTEANLTAARFSGARFQQPDFTHAKNLHLAWTYASPLERKPVRTLLTEGRLDSQDFSNLNLRGLSFKGLNLSNCNFYHADLSEADFSGCDLTGADISEAMVLGTRFSNATMTGALIDSWSMGKHTQFDGVICDYVFIKRDCSERNPREGHFEPGDFTKLYQEVADTISFIAHDQKELAALLQAIKSIRQKGRAIEIQSIENKNESVVVRTQSYDNIDKATAYAEVKAQMEKEMHLLQQQYEKQLLLQKLEMTEIHHQRETELRDKHDSMLEQFINKAIENPKVEIMNDNSRRIEHASINHSAVNLGDYSTVSNHIEQVADAELKAALQTLQQLLAKSHLPGIDKQQAHQAVDELAAVSQKPETERKSLARRSLAFLKDLQQDLSSVAELGEQYGKLLLKVAAWF